METYTREQLLRGEGFFSSGEYTVIYRRKDGKYITAGRHDLPGRDLEIVGGGHLQPNGLPCIHWC